MTMDMNEESHPQFIYEAPPFYDHHMSPLCVNPVLVSTQTSAKRLTPYKHSSPYLKMACEGRH